MIIMKRMVFSLFIEYRVLNIECCAVTLLVPLLLYKSLDRAAQKRCQLRGAQCAVRVHLLVEQGGGESTRDFQIFRVAHHPGNPFWQAGCPAVTI
jgi:hypothetical protein